METRPSSLATRCLACPQLLFALPQPRLLDPGSLPVAPAIPDAESGRREAPTGLAAAPHGLSWAAEPLSDNFDSHNDAGGNHFNEDQSSVKAVPHLVRLRPTLPRAPKRGAGPRTSSPRGRDLQTRRRVGRNAERGRDPGRMGSRRVSRIPPLHQARPPTGPLLPSLPSFQSQPAHWGVLGANVASLCTSVC